MSQLAILGGPRTKGKPFPCWPQYDEKERLALNGVLESRHWWRTEGTQTQEFERAFAKYHGAKHGIAVTNGTAALEVTMAALKIGAGDEVIVPDSTFVATASAVLFAGAMPFMVDVRSGVRIASLATSWKLQSRRAPRPSSSYISEDIQRTWTASSSWPNATVSF